MILETRSLIGQGINRSVSVESDVGVSFEISKIVNQHLKLFTYTFRL